MSDTLQLVADAPHPQHHQNNSTFQVLNECPIRFSLSSTFMTDCRFRYWIDQPERDEQGRV